MQASEAAAAAGVTVKALRYYETLGLLQPVRRRNGYREYSSTDVRRTIEIRTLMAFGLSPRETQPFLDCLDEGHAHADDCAESLAAYYKKIAELDDVVMRLTAARTDLTRRLRSAARRGLVSTDVEVAGLPQAPALPPTLPVPEDDGAAAHLTGVQLPSLALQSTDGDDVALDAVAEARWLLFVYPMTGDPAADIPRGWDDIPGARGCTAEACGFRDEFVALASYGVEQVYGLSADAPAYQDHLVRRLRLPYALLSDPALSLAKGLRLPTFEFAGRRLYRRLTLLIEGSVVRHVFYPVFPPDRHAASVVSWLAGNLSAAAVAEEGATPR